jgi:4a-hydroxytetrahydrobiopterin dehydratase
MAPEPLTDQQIDEVLARLPAWTRDGERISRVYSFPGHLPAAAMVVHVAAVQEELGHHSDLELGYNRVAVSVTTHSEGGRLTDKDVALARRIEELAPAHGAR